LDRTGSRAARSALIGLFGGGRSRPDADGQARRIVLAGEAVDYRLFRSRRRSIGMQIGFAGLTVRAPRWVSIREIERVLAERSEWIRRSLVEWRSRRRDVLPREWKTGAPIVYRGRELALAVFPARQKEIGADLLDLSVRHPAAHDEREVERFVGRWLKDEAQRLVLPQTAPLAAVLGTAPTAVKLSNARSEWGSCNARGEVRLNWRLVQLPPELATYVVAHEVAHLVELNHSTRFWSVVESLYPGHAAARSALHDWTALLEA
jgi:hypothetical protein